MLTSKKIYCGYCSLTRNGDRLSFKLYPGLSRFWAANSPYSCANPPKANNVAVAKAAEKNWSESEYLKVSLERDVIANMADCPCSTTAN